ncbi:translocation protein SEC62 [Coccinella septempunctata]|uniref:translocation protein SEC62 n=1 Tax=Coccinella septempunctata TaxID=41139 RepID=UPI001D075124|nr:translocation protein SEC62 [Coccinella septempunctata]
MADKRKGKKRKEEYVPPGEEVVEKPSKEEYAIAKWMRKNVPIKRTKFLNYVVEYFTGKKAVDALLESKWAKGDDALLKTREDVVDFLHLMLEHKFYHRARKVPVSEQELKARRKDKKKEVTDSGDDKEKKKEKEKEKVTDAESSVVEGRQEQQVEKEKRKMKIRLEMHNDQRFVDSLDAYVWIYDPIPFHYWIIGTLFVLGAIGVCLFPLWPPSVRLGVYYLSVAAAGFLVFIIVLAVLRVIIFSLIWMLTLGKHHLWILPNLTEDVGFFASFWPLYNYEYKGGEQKSKEKGKKKKKKDKDSDAEEEVENKDKMLPEETEKVENLQGQDTGDEGTGLNGSKLSEEENRDGNKSESESESSQRSSTGKDFEMVDQHELES